LSEGDPALAIDLPGRQRGLTAWWLRFYITPAS
jgi:hypothetical protein